jgi:hypothetical protein
MPNRRHAVNLAKDAGPGAPRRDPAPGRGRATAAAGRLAI